MTATGTTMTDLDRLEARVSATRALTERLAAPLGPEDQTVQSMPDVSPTKWHRAHTTWFFEEFVLGPHLPGYRPVHDAYRYLFNSYYEAVGPRHPRPERGLLSRPTVGEIGAYRAVVDRALTDALAGLPREAIELVELGVHHEQQHQELLLMDIKHVLAQNPLDPVYLPETRVDLRDVPSWSWIDHPGAIVDVGVDPGDPGFSFDNESPRHTVLLRPFRLASRPVTNGEWIAFIDDGGYRRPELWLSDGWATVQADGWDAPLYWRRDDDAWTEFTLSGRRPVDPGEPVCHVSLYEADAFAHWAGARLPLEAEWEAVVRDHPVPDSTRFHPELVAVGPVTHGGVWEWTASPYSPYPGFRPAAGAVGEYNGKFMINQHVLRGGSCLTPPGHTRPTYRNFFPPAARWVCSGVRLAGDA